MTEALDRRPLPASKVIADAVRALPGGSLIEWLDHQHLAKTYIRQAMKQHSHYVRGRVLDVGCGMKPYRKLFTGAADYYGVDLKSGEQADVCADALALPFRDETFDTVLTNEVLEHISVPGVLMNEVSRVLKPGGVLLLTTPQTWGLHAEPHDYFRFTKYGLSSLAQQAHLETVSITPTCGIWGTVTQRLVDSLVGFTESGPKWRTRLLRVVLSPVLVIGYGLDALFGKRGDTLDNVLVARRSDKRKPPSAEGTLEQA